MSTKKPFDFYAYIVSEESHSDGKVIVEENSHGTWMYVILEGKATVKKKTAKGEVLIDYLEEGSVFGMSSILGDVNTQRNTSLIANGPVTLGVLDPHKLDKDWISLSPPLRSLLTCLIKKRREALSTVISMSVDLYSNINRVKK